MVRFLNVSSSFFGAVAAVLLTIAVGSAFQGEVWADDYSIQTCIKDCTCTNGVNNPCDPTVGQFCNKCFCPIATRECQ